MMSGEQYYFSANANAFFPISAEGSYKSAGTWPDDGVVVDDCIFIEFTGFTPKGKIRGSDNNGYPCWVDIPPLTHEKLVAIAEDQKRALIAEVSTETQMLQTKLALKRIKPAELELLNAWLDYLDELEAVDASTAPDITWPTKPVV